MPGLAKGTSRSLLDLKTTEKGVSWAENESQRGWRVARGPKSEVRGRETIIRVDPSRPLRVGIRGWFWALEGRGGQKTAENGILGRFGGSGGLKIAQNVEFRA